MYRLPAKELENSILVYGRDLRPITLCQLRARPLYAARLVDGCLPRDSAKWSVKLMDDLLSRCCLLFRLLVLRRHDSLCGFQIVTDGDLKKWRVGNWLKVVIIANVTASILIY